jgi:hypothetical protein
MDKEKQIERIFDKLVEIGKARKELYKNEQRLLNILTKLQDEK